MCNIFIFIFRLELGVDNINIQSDDPFTSHKLKSLWTPVEIVNKLGENHSELFIANQLHIPDNQGCTWDKFSRGGKKKVLSL